jgi:hypothetical protein
MSKKEEPEIIQVGLMDPNKENSPIVEEAPPEEGAESAKALPCLFNGKAYGEGALICMEERVYRCSYKGSWRGTGGNC